MELLRRRHPGSGGVCTNFGDRGRELYADVLGTADDRGSHRNHGLAVDCPRELCAGDRPQRALTPAPTAPATSAPATSLPLTSSPVPSEPAPAPVDPLSQAVWPSPNSDVRYSDPVEAVHAFAVDFVGFVGANFGAFRAVDSRSGEVDVRIGEAGPPTVVFVSQLADDDSWWVTGSGTQNIVVQQPDALTTIKSPLTVNGLARAFEGRVDVELRADDTDQPLFTGFVTGGDGSELEPFEETFEFDSPKVAGGTLVLTTASPDNGNVLEAEVLRYFFAAG